MMPTIHSTAAAPRRASLVPALAIALGLSACASSVGMVNLWKDPDSPKQPMTNVLVVAMKNDAALRRIWEDGTCAALTRYGVHATPSYRPFPTAVPDTQQVITAVRETGFDGILVTHRLDDQTAKTYTPGYTALQPVTVRNPWTGMYQTYYESVHTPGSVETSRVVRHQTDVWSTLEGGHMVWTGTSEVMDPTSSVQVNREITRRLLPELSRQHVIPGLTK
jgi:hypothetical protein